MNNHPAFRFQGASKVFQHEKKSKEAERQNTNSQVNQTKSSYFAVPKSNQEYERDSAQHMNSLHSKLHQEADKIRKWKIQAELDLKDREKKLTEAHSHIETMKKSLIESQLANERTSSKLQEEIENREEITMRINATRDMCSMLKSAAAKIEERLNRCETEKTELKYSGKETMKHVQELTEKFKNLKMTAIENERKIQIKAANERNDQIQKEMFLKTKMDASEDEIKKLREEIANQGNEIINLNSTIKQKENTIQDMTSSVESLQQQVNILSYQLEEKKEKLRLSCNSICLLQEQNTSMDTSIKGLEKKMESLELEKEAVMVKLTAEKSELEEQLCKASEEINEKIADLKDKIERLEQSETKLAEMTKCLENLKTSKEILILEKTDVEVNLETQKFYQRTLMEEKEKDKEEIHRLNGEIGILTKKLDHENLMRMQIQEEYDGLQCKISILELERSDHVDEISGLESGIASNQEKIKSLESLLSEQESKTINLEKNVEDLEESLTCERDKVGKCEDKASLLQENLKLQDECVNEKNQEIDNLKKEIMELKDAKAQMETALQSSTNEIENMKSEAEEKEEKILELETHIKDMSEQNNETGKNLTSQNEKVADLVKQLKAQEKEVKTLKIKLKKEEQLGEKKKKENEELKKELSMEQKEKNEIEQQLENCREEMELLKESCNKDKAEANNQIEKAKEMQAIAQRERDEAKARVDNDLAEMMATMDNYKQSSEKITAGKDEKIQSLENKLEDVEKKLLFHEIDSTQLKENNELLQKTIQELQKEQSMSKDKTKETDAVILQLKDQVSKLEQENSSLKITCSDLAMEKSKLESLSATQVTPRKKTIKPSTPPQRVQPSPIRKSQATPVAPVAPLSPQITVPQTPKTPVNKVPPKTPRSILRMFNSDTKRRKVAFQEAKKGFEFDSSSEESDVLEVDIDQYLAGKSATPLLRKATPKMVSKSNVRMGTTTPSRIPLNQTMREQAESPTPIVSQVEKSKKQSEENSKPSNVRVASSKKFFTSKSGPRSGSRFQNVRKPEKKKEEDWVDMDAIFGFED